MLRYILDEILIKAFDFFYMKSNRRQDGIGDDEDDTNATANYLAKNGSFYSKFLLGNSANLSAINNNTKSDFLLFDDYLSLKKASENAENGNENEKGSSNSSSLPFLNTSIDSYYEEISREFNFENLNKYYSTNTRFKKRYFKMLTSYDKEEFLYSYYDKETENELIDSLKANILKSVKVFQKPYYQRLFKQQKQQQQSIESLNVNSSQVKEKMKTTGALLVMCLNIGVDPPDLDISLSAQYSKSECWINPNATNAKRAMELIGAEIQKQYERWQPGARYKQCLDPNCEDIKKFAISMRKTSRVIKLIN